MERRATRTEREGTRDARLAQRFNGASLNGESRARFSPLTGLRPEPLVGTQLEGVAFRGSYRWERMGREHPYCARLCFLCSLRMPSRCLCPRFRCCPSAARALRLLEVWCCLNSRNLGGRVDVNAACRNDDVRARAAKELCIHVATTSRERSGESFTRFINDVNKRIFDLVSSTDVAEKLGGIMAIVT